MDFPKEFGLVVRNSSAALDLLQWARKHDPELAANLLELWGPMLKPEDPISELEFENWHPYNLLMREGICQIGQLVGKTRFDLRTIHGFGPKSLAHVRERLKAHNLALKD